MVQTAGFYISITSVKGRSSPFHRLFYTATLKCFQMLLLLKLLTWKMQRFGKFKTIKWIEESLKSFSHLKIDGA
jgi:hypothetical protein